MAMEYKDKNGNPMVEGKWYCGVDAIKFIKYKGVIKNRIEVYADIYSEELHDRVDTWSGQPHKLYEADYKDYSKYLPEGHPDRHVEKLEMDVWYHVLWMEKPYYMKFTSFDGVAYTCGDNIRIDNSWFGTGGGRTSNVKNAVRVNCSIPEIQDYLPKNHPDKNGPFGIITKIEQLIPGKWYSGLGSGGSVTGKIRAVKNTTVFMDTLLQKETEIPVTSYPVSFYPDKYIIKEYNHQEKEKKMNNVFHTGDYVVLLRSDYENPESLRKNFCYRVTKTHAHLVVMDNDLEEYTTSVSVTETQQWRPATDDEIVCYEQYAVPYDVVKEFNPINAQPYYGEFRAESLPTAEIIIGKVYKPTVNKRINIVEPADLNSVIVRVAPKKVKDIIITNFSINI